MFMYRLADHAELTGNGSNLEALPMKLIPRI